MSVLVTDGANRSEQSEVCFFLFSSESDVLTSRLCSLPPPCRMHQRDDLHGRFSDFEPETGVEGLDQLIPIPHSITQFCILNESGVWKELSSYRIFGEEGGHGLEKISMWCERGFGEG